VSQPSNVSQRVWATLVATALACVLIGLYIGLYLTAQSGTAVASTTSAGVQLNLATVPAAALNDPHPTWVSYYFVNAKDQNWQHKTTWAVPANSLIHVTLYQYDSATGLRNPFLSQATGTVGGTFDLNGKPTRAVNPNLASHVFAIPALGVSVPLPGVSATAKNPCSNAPCTLSQDHETISFTFRTGAKGLYRWQCFVPCASGYIQGLGGPMQTVGYMDGFLKVV
jgi:hypothetical protein